MHLLTLISWTYCNVLPYLLYFWSKLDGFRKMAWIKVQIQFPKKQKNIVTWSIMGRSSWKLGLFIFYFNAFPSSALVSVHAEVNCPPQTSRKKSQDWIYCIFMGSLWVSAFWDGGGFRSRGHVYASRPVKGEELNWNEPWPCQHHVHERFISVVRVHHTW